MDTKTLKISLAQRILSVADINILKQIDTLLRKKNIIGFDTLGNPVTEEEYINDLDNINKEIDMGSAQLFTSNDVIQKIKDENSLA